MTPAEAPPLTRRLRWLTGLLGLALVAVLVNAALNGGGSDGPANPIRAAALRTELEPGGHVAVEVRYSVPGGQPILATGRGIYDTGSGRSRATFVALGRSGLRQTVHAYADRHDVYASSPTLVSVLPAGLHWVHLEPWLGLNEQMALPSRWSPPSQMSLLRATEEVEDLGQEEVLGVMTDRYGGRIDLGRYAGLLGAEGDTRAAERFRALAGEVPAPMRVEAWVDPGGRLRRLRMVTTLPRGLAGLPTITFDIREDLTSYGRVKVAAPPRAADALDLSPLFRWQLDLDRGQIAPDPAEGPALAPATFQHRASAICGHFKGVAHRLAERSKATFELLRHLKEEGGLDPSVQAEERVLGAYRSYVTAFFTPVAGIGRHLLGEMGSLSPPPAKQATFERYIHIIAVQVETVEAELRAGQLGDLVDGKAINKKAKPLDHESDAAARALGLKACVSPPGGSAEAEEPNHSERPSTT